MSRIAVLGAGAFGTALALVLTRAGRDVTLWARNAESLIANRESPKLPGASLPQEMTLTGNLDTALAETVLLAVPAQSLGGFLSTHAEQLDGRRLIACCKGIDLETLQGPTALIRSACPKARPGLISGPGFAADLAAGLPTAMTLGYEAPDAEEVQALLSGGGLRLYLSGDLTGVELGGAIKNVIAIACGVVIGAGLGESARAALMTRGNAEMTRFAIARGALAQTLSGLSGLGDLVLTCGSEKSRNFRHGLAIGRGAPPEAGATVEGVATALALARAAKDAGVEMPITETLAKVLSGQLDVQSAVQKLLSRPLKSE